ncbi:18203_t:CDS:2, partial [Racocetra persica]
TIQVLDGKMRSLQDEGYGDTDKSDSLTPNKIVSYLNHEYLSINNNEKKNNQGGVFYHQRYGHTNTRSIPIPANNPKNQFIPVKDILLYLSKRPSECQSTDALFLECIRKQS